MIRYEWKKVFSRRSNQIALLLLAVILAVVCRFATDVGYVNPQGETEYGPGTVAALRQTQHAWAGPLDVAKLRAALAENQRVNQATRGEGPDSNIAYAQKQGFMDIRDLCSSVLGTGFQDYDYYLADRLTPDDAARFYSSRTALLRAWLMDQEQQDRYTPQKQAYLLEQYESQPTPWYYDYTKGWTQCFEYSPTVVMVTMLVLGYLVAGIFSNEFAWRSDAIFFSSFHGRGKAVRAKLWAGLGLITLVYWVMLLVFFAVVLGYLGWEGWNCPVQLDRWKVFYHLDMWQAALLTLLGGYIGCLFMGALTMLCSAKTRSAVLAVVVPFVLIFLPTFLGNLSEAPIGQALGLLPDRLLQLPTALSLFDLYQFGDRVVGAIPLVLGLYSLLSLLLLPLLYRVYRRRQIG